MSQVVVIGNVGIDTCVYLPGPAIDWEHEANFTRNVDAVGQAGGYTALGFAGLGYATAFIGHVGDDAGGEVVRRVFAQAGIDTACLWVEPAGTARSVNLVYPNGQRKNFYDGRGHMTFAPDHSAATQTLQGATLAHVHLANWARQLLPYAQAAGAFIACDLQDIRTLDDPYRAEFITFADVVFFSNANIGHPEPLVQALLAAKPERIVIVGMGEQGCALGYRNTLRYFSALQDGAPVVDTNGAGDNLAIGFLSSFVLDGESPEMAIRRGQIMARDACAQRAPKTPMSRQRLASLLAC